MLRILSQEKVLAPPQHQAGQKALGVTPHHELNYRSPTAAQSYGILPDKGRS